MQFIRDPSLVLYVPLYKLDGNPIISEDSYGHKCTITSGPLWSPRGHIFDGSNDEVVCGTNNALSITTEDFTFLVWSRLDTTGSHRVVIGGSTTDAPHLFSRSNETILLSKPSIANAPIASTTMPINRWVFWGCVFDSYRTTNNCEYIFNGLSDGIVTFDQNFGALTNNIGVGNNAGAWHWNGLIGEVAIYKRKLTRQEWQDIYIKTRWRYQ